MYENAILGRVSKTALHLWLIGGAALLVGPFLALPLIFAGFGVILLGILVAIAAERKA